MPKRINRVGQGIKEEPREEGKDQERGVVCCFVNQVVCQQELLAKRERI